MMTYFADLRIVEVGIYPAYRCHLPHLAPRHYSLELVAAGRLRFQREAEPPQLLDYPALRWQAPGRTYSYGPVDEAGWEHYFILLEGDRAARLYHEGFAPLVADGCVLPIRRVDLFRQLFTTIHDLASHGPAKAGWAAFHTEELLVRAMEETAKPEPFHPYRQPLAALCARMRANPQAHHDFRREAAELGLSHSHFRTLFTEYAGMPPHQYLLRARLKVAAARLRQTDAPIKQIASELGLGNPAQFSKAFRAAYARPPAAYRAAEAW